MGILEWFQKRVHGDPSYPPTPELKAAWAQIEAWRRRFRNDYGEMLQHNERFNATEHRRSIYTPVPVAREMARLSASLLFSEPAKITLPDEEDKIRRERDVRRQEEKDARNPFLPGSPANTARDTGGKAKVGEDPRKTGGDPTTTKAGGSGGSKLDPADPKDNPEAETPAERLTASMREDPIKSKRQILLERIVELNGLDAFFQESGEQIAAEGRGAIRVIRDEEVAEGEPFLTFVPEDHILWDVRHGRAVVGATAVWEHVPPMTGKGESKEVYRLFEEHVPGFITRTVYKGSISHIGVKLDAGKWPEVWQGTKPVLETGLDSSTMIRWDNVPGGHSDIAGLDALLDTLDEAESLLTDKGRKSIPITFAARSLADEAGEVPLEGVVLTGDANLDTEYGVNPANSVEVAQPALQTKEHLEWVDHVRVLIAQTAGYSPATWGIGEQGRTDSGTALQLRQARTLLTRSGKERMARDAIQNALAVALAWAENEPSGGALEKLKNSTTREDVEDEATKDAPKNAGKDKAGATSKVAEDKDQGDPDGSEDPKGKQNDRTSTTDTSEPETDENGLIRVRAYRPEVMLGTGLPVDPMEKAQEIATKYTAGVISLRQAVRELHPDWTEDQVDEEVEQIEESKAIPPALMADAAAHNPLAGEGEEDEGADEGKQKVEVEVK